MNRMACEYIQLTLLEDEVQLAYSRIWVRLLGKLKQPVPGQILETEALFFLLNKFCVFSL